MSRVTLTFGVLPSFQQFAEAFSEEFPDGLCAFYRDKRVSSKCFGVETLWKEVQVATGEFHSGKAIRNGIHSELTEEGILNAGDWVSRVLESLKIEWI